MCNILLLGTGNSQEPLCATPEAVLLHVTPALNSPFTSLLPSPSSVAQICVWLSTDLALSNLLGNQQLCNGSAPAVFSLPELSDYSPSLQAGSPPSGGTVEHS